MTESTLHSFTGTDGDAPLAGVTLDADGDIFGTTLTGGANNDGTVYEIKAGTTTATDLYSFTVSGLAGPYGGVTLDADGDIFGTTAGGGSNGDGTVYEIKAGTTTATTLYSFTGTDGSRPSGNVTFDAAGDLFGTTGGGGSENDGIVYEIKAGTTTATTLYSFTGTDGFDPAAGVTLDNAGDIFGTTTEGGSDGDGTVFEIKAGTTAATVLYNFTSVSNQDAFGTNDRVTLDADGNLFGTTTGGGSDNDGTVFEILAGTTAVTTLYSFADNGTEDSGPSAGVILDAAGDLFGTTAGGGSNGDGTVFEIKHGTTTATTLYAFTGTDGAGPLAGVTLDASGDLFGTTAFGGSGGDGTVFEIANAVCYYPGTMISTPSGARPVESLTIGDPVMTADGRSMPVRWIGRNTVSVRFADPLRVLPIRIKAGALGEGLPGRDLLVSPEHAVLVEDILIQAGALVNGVSLTRERDVPETFVYYHVELAEHALILAEGTPAESFVDNIHRMAFDNWAEHEALYGDAPITEMPYPRAQSYRQVPAEIHSRLMARAKIAFPEINVA